MTLSSYYLYNQRYEKKWFKLFSIDVKQIMAKNEEKPENVVLDIITINEKNQVLLGNVIDERFKFFFRKKVKLQNYSYFQNIAKKFNDNCFSVLGCKKSDKDDHVDRLNEIVKSYYKKSRLTKAEFDKIITENFPYIVSNSNRKKIREAFEKKYNKDPNALYEYDLKTSDKVQYATKRIYIYISIPVISNNSKKDHRNVTSTQIYNFIKSFFYTDENENISSHFSNDLKTIFKGRMSYNHQLHLPKKLNIISDKQEKSLINSVQYTEEEQIIDECYSLPKLRLFIALVSLLIMVYEEEEFDYLFNHIANSEITFCNFTC